MGSQLCKSEKDADRENRRIETEIRNEGKANMSKLKFLLLGISDSGKSTIVKQMRLIHLDGFNETEVVNAIFQIRMNIVESFKIICAYILESDIEVTKEERPLVKLFATESNKIEMMQEADELKILNTIRMYASVREFLERYSSHPNVPDNIYYFIPQLERILTSSYVPTSEDLIYMRQTTLGVHEISFDLRRNIIRLIDVGGQKTERRKWIHFFEGVTAVMFLVSMGSFNQITEEESSKSIVVGGDSFCIAHRVPTVVLSWEAATSRVQNKILVRSESSRAGKARISKPGTINRLDEAVELFKSIRDNNFLFSSNFMLFMNKRDILEKKLEALKFSDYFPGYATWLTTDNSVSSVSEYMEGLFREGLAPERKMYSHHITATNTLNTDFVFGACCEVIFNNSMDSCSME